MSDIISEAFDISSDSDYNDYFVISKKEVEEQRSNAQYFYDRVEEHVVALLPVCNSPRMGVCDYCGSDIYPDQFLPDIEKTVWFAARFYWGLYKLNDWFWDLHLLWLRRCIIPKIGVLNARKISTSVLIKVSHKMIIIVIYRMAFKYRGECRYGNLFKSGKWTVCSFC